MSSETNTSSPTTTAEVEVVAGENAASHACTTDPHPPPPPTAAPDDHHHQHAEEEEEEDEEDVEWDRDRPHGNLNEDELAEDRRIFDRTVLAFRQYGWQAHTTRSIRYANAKNIPARHLDLLGGAAYIDATFARYKQCINMNQAFQDVIADASQELYANYWPKYAAKQYEAWRKTGLPYVDPNEPPAQQPTSLDFDKAFSTLRQFVRDWSAEGKVERDQVYVPIQEVLCREFPDRRLRSDCRVLVPGGGLCRLSVELALLGFSCQANEFSYHMLIGAHYIQNHVQCAGQHRIAPYCDGTCNLVRREDQFQEVLIPDLCTFEAVDALHQQGLNFGQLSMVAGDFTEVYRRPHQHNAWQAVVTCFFIDTAHNVLEYLEILYDMLCPGGLWINVGPLLYHFADNAGPPSRRPPAAVAATHHSTEANTVKEMPSSSAPPPPPPPPPAALPTHRSNGHAEGDNDDEDYRPTIEISLEEVLLAAGRLGFEVVDPPRFIDTTYTNNVRAMKQLVYRAAFFVLRKPNGAAGSSTRMPGVNVSAAMANPAPPPPLV